MTCNDALRALLDADLEAVAAGEASPLGHHVACCARCQAVLAELRADTSRLATVTAQYSVTARVAAPQVRRSARWLLLPIPVAATAALAFVVLTHTEVARTTPGVSPMPASRPAPTTAVAPTTDATDVQAAPTRAVARVPVAQPVLRGKLIAATPLPPIRLETGGPLLAHASAPVPVSIDAGAISDGSTTVAVAPAEGRAVVLRPSNANITVVWFY